MLKQQEQLKNRLKTNSTNNTGVIDVHDLQRDDVKFIKNFVELLRKREKLEHEPKEKNKKIKFAEWNLKVKGKLGRDEIYGYL